MLTTQGLFHNIFVDMVKLDEVELELDESLHGVLIRRGLSLKSMSDKF